MLRRSQKVKHVIDLIVSSFTEEELEKLSFPGDYSFKESLNDLLYDYKLRHNLKMTKNRIKYIVERYRRNPCLEEEKRLYEEIEVRLFKPTLICRIRLWEARMWAREWEKRYELSFSRSLNRQPKS